MFKVTNKDTRTTPLRCSGVFTVNFEQISHLTRVSNVNFEHLISAILAIICIAVKANFHFLMTKNIYLRDVYTALKITAGQRSLTVTTGFVITEKLR